MVTGEPPVTVDVDLAHGGRWTSLRAGRREWLWHRPDPARETAEPGEAFVDAGGVEECIPTVRGIPDHGDAWARPWSRIGDTDVLRCAEFALRRRFHRRPFSLVVSYQLAAEPGYRFIWAAHALLDLSQDAVLRAPAGTATRLFPEAAGLIDSPWPDDASYVTGAWPAPRGLRMDRLGPDDGTAVGAVITDCADATVIDGVDALTFRLDADDDVPVSVAVWRNLGGFPPESPYRSIGVEPMLGSVFDLAEAGPDDAATVPASGRLRWELEIIASPATRTTARATGR